MQFSLTLNLDNAAFQDDEERIDQDALAGALAKLAQQFTDRRALAIPSGAHHSIRDSNGNSAGMWSVGL